MIVFRQWSWSRNWLVLWIPSKGLRPLGRRPVPAAVQYCKDTHALTHTVARVIWCPSAYNNSRCMYYLQHKANTLPFELLILVHTRFCFFFPLLKDLIIILFIELFFCVSLSALCIHNEVHQSAASAVGRPHPQTSTSCSDMDGLSPGLLPWTAGQIIIWEWMHLLF